jgi:hypothetical protein
MSVCPHTDREDKCACYPGCGCDTISEPESWAEYELCYSIFDNAPEDATRIQLRDQMSAAIKERRCVHVPNPPEHVVTRINDHYYVCDECGKAGNERWAILHQFPTGARL